MSVSEDHFDLYEVIATLGHGAFGSVYKIKRKTDGKLFTYKKIQCLTKEEEEKIRKEAEILSNLHNENIIEFVEAFRHDGNFYIVTDLAEGGNLLNFYTKKRNNGEFITEEESWRILKEITSGVAYLHSNRILHRNIKPGNILLTADGTVKIADFTIAKQLGTGYDFASTMCGSKIYMSPELTTNGKQSFPSDIYAIGLTIHEILTLQRPFDARTMFQLIQNSVEGKVAAEIDPSRYSKDLIDIVNSMRNVNPEQRPTAEQILAHPRFQNPVQQQQFPIPTSNEVPFADYLKNPSKYKGLTTSFTGKLVESQYYNDFHLKGTAYTITPDSDLAELHIQEPIRILAEDENPYRDELTTYEGQDKVLEY
ncbi:MAG: putative Serine/threonine-protein kinase Nek3, partial [Streblomastix strix]